MKNKIILAETIIIIVLCFFVFQGQEIKTQIKTVEKIVRVTDTRSKTQPTKVEKVRASVANETQKSKNNKKANASRYVYKDTLKNAYLTSIIIANKIYQRDIEVTSFDKHIETEIKKTVFKPTFYIAPSVSMHELSRVNEISLKAYMANKNIILGAGVGVDLQTRQLTYPITIGFKF